MRRGMSIVKINCLQICLKYNRNWIVRLVTHWSTTRIRHCPFDQQTIMLAEFAVPVEDAFGKNRTKFFTAKINSFAFGNMLSLGHIIPGGIFRDRVAASPALPNGWRKVEEPLPKRKEPVINKFSTMISLKPYNRLCTYGRTKINDEDRMRL